MENKLIRGCNFEKSQRMIGSCTCGKHILETDVYEQGYSLACKECTTKLQQYYQVNINQGEFILVYKSIVDVMPHIDKLEIGDEIVVSSIMMTIDEFKALESVN